MGETKIIYHLDDQETPYLVKLSVPADKVTLADFKNVLKKPNYKFFFKSMDDDFGVVKEEISDDNAKLPCFNGRVVSWHFRFPLMMTPAGNFSFGKVFLLRGGIGPRSPPRAARWAGHVPHRGNQGGPTEVPQQLATRRRPQGPNPNPPPGEPAPRPLLHPQPAGPTMQPVPALLSS